MEICINGICGRDPNVRWLDGGSFAKDCIEGVCKPCRPEAVQKVYDFLRPHIVFSKRFSPRRGSYGWKHDAQRVLGEYVSNGEFLEAFRRFPEAQIKGNGLNARVNIAYRKTLRRAGLLVNGLWRKAPYGRPMLRPLP
jgi:hypothetical protein